MTTALSWAYSLQSLMLLRVWLPMFNPEAF